MQAHDPLMIEHRLIERMIATIKTYLKQIESTQEVDPVFIDKAVDFICTYADQIHHCKEEDILFRELCKKDLSAGYQRAMQELIEEHIFGRKTAQSLIEANTRYRNGDKSALTDITSKLNTFADFYPNHIQKEDKFFFPVSRDYFTYEEDQAMLTKLWDFGHMLIHEKYRIMVEGLE